MPKSSSRLENIEEETSREALKIRALSNEFRRLVLGLLYSEGSMYQSDILKHVNIKSNLLAYHLDILCRANMVERRYGERKGANFAIYSIKEEGEKFLELIGAKRRLEKIKKKQTQRPRKAPHKPRLAKVEVLDPVVIHSELSGTNKESQYSVAEPMEVE